MFEEPNEGKEKQAVSFVNELNRYRHAHPEWIFVDVESSDGDKIQITF